MVTPLLALTLTTIATGPTPVCQERKTTNLARVAMNARKLLLVWDPLTPRFAKPTQEWEKDAAKMMTWQNRFADQAFSARIQPVWEAVLEMVALIRISVKLTFVLLAFVLIKLQEDLALQAHAAQKNTAQKTLVSLVFNLVLLVISILNVPLEFAADLLPMPTELALPPLLSLRANIVLISIQHVSLDIAIILIA